MDTVNDIQILQLCEGKTIKRVKEEHSIVIIEFTDGSVLKQWPGNMSNISMELEEKGM